MVLFIYFITYLSLHIQDNFTALDKYQAFSYIDRDSNDRKREKGTQRSLRVKFPESINLRTGRNYRLLYFQSTGSGSNSISSLAGVSEPFPVRERPPSPKNG